MWHRPGPGAGVTYGSAEGDTDCAHGVRGRCALERQRAPPPPRSDRSGDPGVGERMLGPRTGQNAFAGDAWGLGSSRPSPRWRLRMGLGSSVHHDGCSELGMTPWFLSSMDVKSLSRPIPLPTPRVTWSKCGRQALSQPHPTHHSAGGLFPGVLEGRARQQEGCSA